MNGEITADGNAVSTTNPRLCPIKAINREVRLLL
jgi:hypothetical protein